MKKIRVLIVEDSKLMQTILKRMLESDLEIEVVGVADDPLIARDMIKKINPDVLTLDIMMPHMDGITFLKNLMRLRPTPVVMVSSLTQKSSAFSLEALALGAVDYIPKPSRNEIESTEYAKNLVSIVKNAAYANVYMQIPKAVLKPTSITTYQENILQKELIIIGASTGGIEAIETILIALPKIFPPIIVTQHIKKEFCNAFATRINKLCNLEVALAKHLEELTPGKVYIAPGELHIKVERKNDRYYCILEDSSPIHGHKPSVDVLFHSVAKAAKDNCIAILLTGMGIDGAKGLKAIHDIGGTTIVQDKETSIVWGMPGEAVKLNAADYILPITKIAKQILSLLDEKALTNKKIKTV